MFYSYSALIMSTSIVFVVFIYVYASGTLRERTSESLEGVVASLSQRLDDRVRAMDTVSMTVAYSILLDYSNARLSTAPFLDRADGASSLVTMLQSIIGPFQTVPEVYLHTARGWSVGAGLYNGYARVDAALRAWYPQVIARSGVLYLTAPHPDPAIARAIPVYDATRYVSLARQFFDLYGKPQGVIEVEQTVDALFSDLKDAAPDRASEVLVLDEHGAPLYRSEGTPPLDPSGYLGAVRAERAARGSLVVRDDAERLVVTYVRSPYTGWAAVIAEPERDVLAPVYSFTKLTLTGSLVVVLLTLALSFFVARRLTDPIKELHEALRRLDSDVLLNSEPVSLNSDLNELDELNVAFEAMHLKLRESVEDLIRVRSHEAQTRILALQSRMNPHFLYNLLSTVAAMAEERMNDEIVKLCRSLSSVFRYVSTDLEKFVELETEIEFVREYLRCMEYRLSDGLRASITLPESVRDVRVPKLIVQPLVENALKHGSDGERAPRIDITAGCDQDRWYVAVRDRGPGFGPPTLAILGEKIRTIDREGPQDPMDPNGIGLTNVYTRLRILYGERALFRVVNAEDGGASVTVGGTIDGR